MARGKYAARAANARAGAAQDNAAELRAQLAAAQQAHSHESAELNRTITQLRAEATTEARRLAAAEIERIQAQCDEQVRRLLADLTSERSTRERIQATHDTMIGKLRVLLDSLGFSSAESQEIFMMLVGAPGRTIYEGGEHLLKFGVDGIRNLQRAKGDRGRDEDLQAIERAISSAGHPEAGAADED